MAPSPEYDKEPKAPDKNSTNSSSEDPKVLHNLVNDQQTNSDHKPASNSINSEVENNKHVSTLDDGQLRALLDEAITYKCPKDREGKSVLFKELLQEAEQDEQQECEAAARSLGRARHQLPHSNSLQDLMAALTAETAPRRHHQRHHAAPPPSVSARAIYGGSLPSGVDTSSLGEEPARAGYLATVRCVNPPPLAERRVSASDSPDLDPNRRSKPMFPMTYTARATLEIGSGSVGSGRAVTTTTASNQVAPPAEHRAPRHNPPPVEDTQAKLLRGLCPRAGGRAPRGATGAPAAAPPSPIPTHLCLDNVNKWYEGLAAYSEPLLFNRTQTKSWVSQKTIDTSNFEDHDTMTRVVDLYLMGISIIEMNDTYTHPSIGLHNIAMGGCISPSNPSCQSYIMSRQAKENNFIVNNNSKLKKNLYSNDTNVEFGLNYKHSTKGDKIQCDIRLTKEYRRHKVSDLMVPSISLNNPRNVRRMTIGKPETVVPKANKDADKVRNYVAVENNLDIGKCSIENVTSFVSNQDNFTLFSTKTNDSDTEGDSAKSGGSGQDIEIELKDVSTSHHDNDYKSESFSQYCAEQQKLLHLLESAHVINKTSDINSLNEHDFQNIAHIKVDEEFSEPTIGGGNVDDTNVEQISKINVQAASCDESSATLPTSNEIELQLNKNPTKRANDGPGDRHVPTELPNNAYIFLTLPKCLVTPLTNKDDDPQIKLRAIESNNNDKPCVPEGGVAAQSADTNKNDTSLQSATRNKKKKECISKNALRILLFENIVKSDKSMSGKQAMSPVTHKEVDSAIPFSCITSPEVVASCNTTSSAQAAAALDTKPLQPGEVPAPPAPPQPPAPPLDPLPPAALHAATFLPRSVISSSFNGLPLSRPNYGSTATDDFKKSLDENGNSVQGFSSPLSGSSQHKKPRRKKSSNKNETLIDCEKIDGYQGDKDVNELLRFIESNVESGRGHKQGLGRKHRDDCYDKGKKRRKDKEPKLQRASSLEELSRTTLEELTAPKAERRSWGDERPHAPDPPEPPDHLELTDFQTVTKRRKPRRRTDPPGPGPPRRAHPPSDRSNDSNDDQDSVHSLPPDAPPPRAPPAPASYADIARTRHNIPDLIESCNFYGDGDGDPAAGGASGPDYPALEARRRARDKAAARRPDKARAPPSPPAPDVLGDPRPPVLLPAPARLPDMDGVTFGFDINEQLLGAAGRRARCDLVRDAAPPALRVRFVPPSAPPASPQLPQLVDFVGAAWEDVIRCGSKLRYFTE